MVGATLVVAPTLPDYFYNFHQLAPTQGENLCGHDGMLSLSET